MCDGLADLGFNREGIGEIAIEVFGPEMGIGRSIDQLHAHANTVPGALHTALDHIANAELPRDLAQVASRGRGTLVLHHRSAADHFQISQPRETAENFILHAVGEIGVFLFTAEIRERQHCNRLFRNALDGLERRRGGVFLVVEHGAQSSAADDKPADCNSPQHAGDGDQLATGILGVDSSTSSVRFSPAGVSS